MRPDNVTMFLKCICASLLYC